MPDNETVRDRIRREKDEKLVRQRQWCGILREAIATGRAAGEQATPTPMIVYEANLDGSPRQGGKVYEPVMDGVCGFAWVELYPHDTDTRRFVNWLIGKQAPAAPDCDPAAILGDFGRAGKKYGTGYDIWIYAFNQSMTRKDCAARAIAEKLRQAVPGLKAYANSRMD
jgi:hypothetical protein